MSERQHVAVYPGSFDPIHNGHLDVIRRAVRVVDHLIIAVAENAGKEPLFAVAERARLVESEMARLAEDGRLDHASFEVRFFNGLLVNFAAEVGATAIVRGLRAVSDFEYEFQMAATNARLRPEIETVFLMATESNQFISSRFVKEIAKLGGDVSSFVSPEVRDALVRACRGS